MPPKKKAKVAVTLGGTRTTRASARKEGKALPSIPPATATTNGQRKRTAATMDVDQAVEVKKPVAKKAAATKKLAATTKKPAAKGTVVERWFITYAGKSSLVW